MRLSITYKMIIVFILIKELIYKSNVKTLQSPQIASSYSAYRAALTTWDSNKIE
ncbi:hypothetical protein VSO92_14200 [Myroides pelagicus]|nr:hypothetical protein [Myroides pelagicus]